MNRTAIVSWLVIAVLTITSICIGLFSKLSYLQSFRIVFGAVFLLFLPGFIISFIFFKGKESIDYLERIALSFALSIAVVPLVLFYLNLIGLKINLVNSVLSILGIIILSTVVIVLQLRKENKNKRSSR